MALTRPHVLRGGSRDNQVSQRGINHVAAASANAPLASSGSRSKQVDGGPGLSGPLHQDRPHAARSTRRTQGARSRALAAAVPDSKKAAPSRPPSGPAPHQEQEEEEEEDPAHYVPVVCPAGKQPGQLMKVDTPEGKAVYVEIPKGAKAGAEFEAFIGPRHLACVRILLERTLCPCNALPCVSPCRRGVISLTIARCIAAQSTAREDTAWSALGRSTACCWAETLATRTAAAAAGGGGEGAR